MGHIEEGEEPIPIREPAPEPPPAQSNTNLRPAELSDDKTSKECRKHSEPPTTIYQTATTSQTTTTQKGLPPTKPPPTKIFEFKRDASQNSEKKVEDLCSTGTHI